MMSLTCAVCGREFRAEWPKTNVKVCSAQCRLIRRNLANTIQRNSRRLRPNRTCEICGVQFWRERANESATGLCFCSKRCAGLARNIGLTMPLNWRTCVECDGEWLATRGSTNKYCTDDCREAGTRKKKRDWMRQHSRYVRDRTARPCMFCGTNFEPGYSRRRRFCSPRCCSGYSRESDHLITGEEIRYKLDPVIRQYPANYLQAVHAIRTARKELDRLWNPKNKLA